MNRFEIAVGLTLDYEGGGKVSRDPADPGGVTRWGIASRWHPGVDVENLSRADAVEILRAEYWARIHAEELPWPLAAVLFDHAVHGGARRAAETLQDAVGATVDGIVGARTLSATWRRWNAAPIPLLRTLFRRRIAQLQLATIEGAGRFQPGWMARCADLAFWAGRELEREALWSGREPLQG